MSSALARVFVAWQEHVCSWYDRLWAHKRCAVARCLCVGLCLGAALFFCVVVAFFVAFFTELLLLLLLLFLLLRCRCVVFAVLAPCLLLVCCLPGV